MSIPKLDPKFQNRLEKAGAAWATEDQAEIMDIPNHGDFPIWVLPEASLAFSSDLGYFACFKAFTDAKSRRLLVAQIFSFELKEGAGGWAIPAKYTPRDEGEKIRMELGFDERWEHGAPGPMFLIDCTEKWKSMFKLALEQDQLGIAVTSLETIYPSTLNPYAKEALEAVGDC